MTKQEILDFINQLPDRDNYDIGLEADTLYIHVKRFKLTSKDGTARRHCEVEIDGKLISGVSHLEIIADPKQPGYINIKMMLLPNTIITEGGDSHQLPT